jgi:hypothetical protein
MNNETFIISQNLTDSSAKVELGYSSEKILNNEKFSDMGLVVTELDVKCIKIDNVTEDNYTLIIQELNKIGKSMLDEFCERCSMNTLKIQVSNGVSVLTDLKNENIDKLDEDDVVIVIDDLLSCEEQIMICKNKIIENLSLSPVIGNELLNIISIMDSMASNHIIKEESLNLISRELFNQDFSKDLLTHRQIISIKKIAVVDFLIENSDNYLSTYILLDEKMKKVC